MSIKRILTAVDGSPTAAYAADAGLSLALQLGVEVAYVAVVNPASVPCGVLDNEDDGLAMEKEEARSMLKCVRRPSHRHDSALVFLETGGAAVQIVETAKAWAADLVFGTHGRNAVANGLAGSVAQRVLRHAPCPVMLVGAFVSESISPHLRNSASRATDALTAPAGHASGLASPG